MASKSTVVVIDNHRHFRDGLKSIIGRNAEFQVVGEAGNAKDGLDLIKKLKPDLVTIDMPLPDNDGIDFVQSILRLSFETRVIVISMNYESNYIYDSFNAGVKGYMVKTSASESLMDGFRALMKGDYYLDHTISQHVVKYMIKSSGRLVQISDTRYDTLTAKEQEITRLLAYGYTDDDIAKKLGFDSKTVKDCHDNIFEKLGVNSSLDLTRYASMIGLIDPDTWGQINRKQLKDE